MFENYWRRLSLPMQLKIASQVCFFCLWSEVYNFLRARAPVFIRRRMARIKLEKFDAHWVEEI